MLFPSRQGSRFLPCFLLETEFLEKGQGLFLRLFLLRPGEAQGKGDVIQGGARFDQFVMLEQKCRLLRMEGRFLFFLETG